MSFQTLKVVVVFLFNKFVDYYSKTISFDEIYNYLDVTLINYHNNVFISYLP